MVQKSKFLQNSRVLKFSIFHLWWVGGVYGSLHMVSLITCSWKECSFYLGHCIQTTRSSRLCRNCSLHFDHCIKMTVFKTHFQRDLVGKTSVYVWVTVSKFKYMVLKAWYGILEIVLWKICLIFCSKTTHFIGVCIILSLVLVSFMIVFLFFNKVWSPISHGYGARILCQWLFR